MDINRINKIWVEGDKLFADITFTPVQPVKYVSMSAVFYPNQISWRKVLDDMYLRYGSWSDKFPDEQEKLAQLDGLFREKFPGPYVIEEFYDAKLGRFNVRLKFAEPKDETMFILKHSA